MSAHRYRSEELPYGVTREAIGWLGPKKQQGIVIAWVQEHFTPCHPDHVLFSETDTWEAYEQARDEFEGIVPTDVIESALAQLPGEWVATSTPKKSQIERYDDQRLHEFLKQARAGALTRIGAVDELQERARLEGVLAKLRTNIAEIEGIVGKLGDNGGPTDISTPQGQLAHLTSHVDRVAKQIASANPNPTSVAESAIAIQGIAAQNKWLSECMEDGARAYVKSFCETAGKDHARFLNGALLVFVVLLFQLLTGCTDWLDAAIVAY